MDSSWKFLISSLTTLTFLLTLAQPRPLGSFCSNSNGNFTHNSTYEANLNSLLSSFSSNKTTNDFGFYNISYGRGSDAANGVLLCRGDVNTDACLVCFKYAAIELRNLCPNQMEAIIWYEFCMLRYTNRSILGVADMAPTYYLRDESNVTDWVTLNQGLRPLFDSLISKASSGNSLRKFATGTALETIRALVQCTPDLNATQCSYCLSLYVNYTKECCERSAGATMIGPSCRLMYGISDFYNVTGADSPLGSSPPPSPPLPPQPTPALTLSPPPSNDTTSTIGKKSNSSRIVIITTVSVVAFAGLLISSCIFFIIRVWKTKVKLQKPMDEIRGDVECLQYDFSIIRVATNDFSDANKLGQGGFGAVYKGKLANGELVAVKRLAGGSWQGDPEFKNEFQLVAQLQHKNLVKLRGFCIEGNERLLIYEFVPCGSLDQVIFDAVKRAYLDWERRHKIIGGIARGLLYLHEDSRLRIFHRDLKASNILLDAEMNPKISDFGLARLCPFDQTQDITSRIAGTYGYMAPEYAMHGQISAKSDVYSFGVLVLEILSGQRNSAFRNGVNVEDLLSYAWRNWVDGTVLNLVDPPLMRDGSTAELTRCIHIGLLCVQENVAQRPDMASVVLMLTSYSVSLPLPSQPPFFMDSNTQSNMMGSDGSNLGATESNQTRNEEDATVVSNNDVSITELYPR